jgi:Protein of unknown function (DUF3617)
MKLQKSVLCGVAPFLFVGAVPGDSMQAGRWSVTTRATGMSLGGRATTPAQQAFTSYECVSVATAAKPRAYFIFMLQGTKCSQLNGVAENGQFSVSGACTLNSNMPMSFDYKGTYSKTTYHGNMSSKIQSFGQLMQSASIVSGKFVGRCIGNESIKK